MDFKAIIQDAKKTRKIDLSHMQLTEIPEQVLKIKNLEQLNLSHNSITSIPNSISYLTSLKILDLSSNQLTSVPRSISSCKSLETLILSYNPNLDSLPESLLELDSLRDVRLFENELFPAYARNNVGSLFAFLSEKIEQGKPAAALKEQQRLEELEAARSQRKAANKDKRVQREFKDRRGSTKKHYDNDSKSFDREIECYD